MNVHFNDKDKNESYLHNYAKQVLKSWLSNDFLRIDIESKFCEKSKILFIPDVACYNDFGISDIFEVVYKSDLTFEKIWKIENYCKSNEINLKVHTIEAFYILKQIKRPERIITKDKFSFYYEKYDK